MKKILFSVCVVLFVQLAFASEYWEFSSSPNITGDKTEDGYNTIETRIKIDEKLTDVWLTQDWGANFLHVGDGHGSQTFNKPITREEFINSLPKANKVLLELSWYGNGDVYFPYSMSGSAASLAQLNSQCK